MQNIFSYDSKVMRTLGMVSDVLLIGLLWLVCCLPVVTIGASSTAAYYTITKVVHKKMGYITKEFIKSFKLNLKDATILTVVFVILGSLLVFNIYTMYTALEDSESAYPIMMLFLYAALFVMLLCVMMYIFPALSRFTMGKMKLVRFSVSTVFRHFISTPILLAMLIVTVVIIIIFPIGVIFMPGVYLYIESIVIEKILRKYMSGEMLDKWDELDSTVH